MSSDIIGDSRASIVDLAMTMIVDEGHRFRSALRRLISIGTNDLTATALGLERTANAPKVDTRVLTLVRRVISAARACGRRTMI